MTRLLSSRVPEARPLQRQKGMIRGPVLPSPGGCPPEKPRPPVALLRADGAPAETAQEAASRWAQHFAELHQGEVIDLEQLFRNA
eukprot:15480200-Alexandrium_andersonii.AAC.1